MKTKFDVVMLWVLLTMAGVLLVLVPEAIERRAATPVCNSVQTNPSCPDTTE